MVQDSTLPKLRIAICGGGIGGLTLACVLDKFSKGDIQVDTYEAAGVFTEIGGGITAWKRPWSILKTLGLDVGLTKMAIIPPQDESRLAFVFRKSDQPEGYTFWRMTVPYGYITLHRADMLKVLTEDISPASTHFNKRLSDYEQVSESGPLILHFQDGTKAEADVLVGCDGIRSATRRTMFGSGRSPETLPYVEPDWTGTVGYRGLFPTGDLLKINPEHRAAREPMLYCGQDKHIVCYPVSGGKLINLVTLLYYPEGEGQKYSGPWTSDATHEELLAPFRGWETEVQQLLQCATKPSRWVIGMVRKLPFCVAGHVALLGDAAHAMPTHHGAGAGQAIEDAYTLGRLLCHPSVTLATLSQALQVYQRIRLPFALDVHQRARASGLLYDFNWPHLGMEPTPEYLEYFKEEATRQWAWHFEKLPEEDWVGAEAILRGMLESEGSNKGIPTKISPEHHTVSDVSANLQKPPHQMPLPRL